MRTFSVLIHRDPEVDDAPWVAHCLDWDLVSQGTGPRHAIAMIAEAIQMVAEDDAEIGLDPDHRKSADESEWRAFLHAQEAGTKVRVSDLESIAHLTHVRIAAAINIELANDGKPDEWRERHSPFAISQIADNHCSA